MKYTLLLRGKKFICTFEIFVKSSKCKKTPRVYQETFKNYASYIHTLSLTDNFQNLRKKGKKRDKNLLLEAVFRLCSIKNLFLKMSQNS